MRYKKIMVLAIFFVSLLAVSAVSAADNITDDVVSVRDITDEVVSAVDSEASNVVSDDCKNDNSVLMEESNHISVYSVNYNLSNDNNCENLYSDDDTNLNKLGENFYEDILSADGTYSELSNKIRSLGEGNTLKLTKDYKFTNSGGFIQFSQNNIIIDGQGHTIDANNKNSIFVVEGKNVVIKNINFKNAMSDTDGGAVYWIGTSGRLINCNFTNNQVFGENINVDGGAVYWEGNSGQISNCKFDNNFGSDGGAVYWVGKNGKIINSIFLNNHGEYSGAAVYYAGASGTISGSVFNNNYGVSGGGAISWMGDSGQVLTSKFSHNKCDSAGGAISWEGKSGKLSQCIFDYNTNCDKNVWSSHFGGAVYWGSASGEISLCNFSNNNASGHIDEITHDDANGCGGAIYVNSYSYIKNCNFNNNYADFGGAIYSSKIKSIMYSNFMDDNSSYGDEICWGGSLCSIINSSFNNEKINYDKYFFIFNKINPTVVIETTNITLNELLNIKIKLNEGFNGNVSINLNNKWNNSIFSSLKNLSDNEGFINFQVFNLTWGEYTLHIIYHGDNIYNSYSKKINVIVFKLNSNITFGVKDINWGDSVNISPTVSDNATGFIKIYVNGEYIDQMSVGMNYSLFNIGGPYSDITLVYLGDDYYNSSSCTKRVYVTRLDSMCNISGNLEVNNYASVYVTLNEDATGKVSVTIQGTKYTSNLVDGVATFSIPNLPADVYNVPIEYEGNSKYKSFNVNKPLEVTLKQSIITLNINNILTGNNVIIRPGVTYGATGNLKIYVDDVLKSTISIGSSYTLTAPKIGKHDVRVVYAGDSYHQGSEIKTTFRVFTFYPIEVQNSAIISGTDKHFQAIFYDEYGNVADNKLMAFRVNGEDTVVMTDANGLAVFNKDLLIGTYSVTVINAYVNEEHNYQLKVFTSIESEDMTRAYNTGIDFKVKLLDENGDTLSKGYALFKVNNKDYPVVADNNGIAILNANLPVGTYTVTTTNGRTGETKTNKISIVSSVNVNNMVRGYNSDIDFKAQFLDADAKPLINQKVAFIVDNVEYEVTTDANGYGVLNEQLDVGDYEVTIVNKATGERAVKNLTVVGRIVENNDVIRIYSEESYYTIRVVGDDGNFVGANEIVNININNVDYQIRTNVNGYASFRIDENIGSYDIFAEYKGYGIYNKVYVLQKVNYISKLDVGNIDYKQNAVINMLLSSFDSNALLKLEVNGENGYYEIFNQLASNSITLPVSGLNASKYTVTAKYYDLNNYKFSTASKSFNVNKIDPRIIVVVEDANVGETAKITVNIPDVTGYVEIKVDNALVWNEYLVKNGVIIKEFDNLSAGYYKVDVTYQGNNNYNKLTRSEDLLIIQPKTATNIIVSPTIKTTFDKTVNLVATLKDDSGNILSDIGMSIFFNGKNNIITTDAKGQVKLVIKNLVPKYYTATITFAGNDYYLKSTKSVKVTIAKATPKLTAKSQSFKVKVKTKKYTVTLKTNQNKVMKNVKLTLKVNKKTYSAKTNKKGQATFKITKLTKKGNFVATVKFAGNKCYNAKTVKPKITIK